MDVIKETLATRPIVAKDIMTAEAVTLTEDTGLAEAAEELIRHRVSNAPVIERDFTRRILVGFVSEKDLMQAYANGWFYKHPEMTVREVMRGNPVCVTPDADLFALAAIFMQHGFRHVPVVSAHMLLGVVSRHDVLKALIGHYKDWQALPESKRKLPDLAQIFTPHYLVG